MKLDMSKYEKKNPDGTYEWTKYHLLIEDLKEYYGFNINIVSPKLVIIGGVEYHIGSDEFKGCNLACILKKLCEDRKNEK